MPRIVVSPINSLQLAAATTSLFALEESSQKGRA